MTFRLYIRCPEEAGRETGLPSGVHLEGEFFQFSAVPRMSVRQHFQSA